MKEAAREGSLHIAASLLLLADVKAADSTLKLSLILHLQAGKVKSHFCSNSNLVEFN